MVTRALFPVLVALLASGRVAGQAPAPERVVRGSTLQSARDPAVTLELRAPVQYVGAARWVLYGVADCEVHVFVEADSAKRVSRLYWIQFEGYLPEISAQYNGYNSPIRVDLGGGREFIVDGGLFRTDSPSRAGSDRERVQEILSANGYSLPPGMMMRRMVHLPTPDRRKELMIIYAEDLGLSGYTVADLADGGRAASERPRLAQETLQRAVERIITR